MSFSDEIVVLKTQWGPLEGADAPRLPRTLAAVAGRERVDGLNVCEAADEAAHEYEYASFAGSVRLSGAARVEEYAGGEGEAGERVADSGRVVRGYERFTVATRPGRDLLIVSRTASSARAFVWTVTGGSAYDLDLPEAVVTLSVNGQPAGTSSFRPRPGWDEIVLRVEAARIVGTRTRLDLRGHYAAFRYWLYQ